MSQLSLYYTQWYCIWENNAVLSAEYSSPVIIILVDFHKLWILGGISAKIWYFSPLRVTKLWVWKWSFSRRERVYGELTRSREKESFAEEVMCRFIGNNGTYLEKQILLLNNQWRMYYMNQWSLYYTQWCYIQLNDVTLSGEHSSPVIIILVDFR